MFPDLLIVVSTIIELILSSTREDFDTWMASPVPGLSPAVRAAVDTPI
jgi:hypothetical protein